MALTKATATLVYATLGRRFAAFLIDWIVLIGVGIVFLLLLYITQHSIDAAVDPLPQLVGWVVFWLYYALMDSSGRQGTVGKWFVGIKVTDLNEHRISFLRATARFVGRLLSTLPFGVGFLFALFTKRKQTLHDLIAGCVVVKWR